MACDFCNCFSLGCSPNCCDFEFIINDTPVLATQDGLHVLSYIQEGQNNKKGALQFLIGDPILFPAAWFNSEGLVKFELTLPDNTVFEFETYTCFEFERVISATPENSEMVVCLGSNNPSDICTVCDLLEALGVSSQLLVEIRDKVLFLDVPLSELGKETTLQDILTSINDSGGAYALESTLQLVLTALNGLALDSTLQSILTALGTGLAQETTLQTVAKETTLQSVLTALSSLSTQTTLAQVLTQLQTLNLVDFSTETTLQALLLAIQSLPAGGDATAANQVLEIAQLTTLNSKDFATQTTLQSVLTALGPLATQTTVGQILTELQSLNTVDFATQTTLASVLSQLNNVSLESTLQSVLTELQTLNLKDFSTETTLQLVLAALLLSGQEITLQSILTALGPLATEVTLGQVLLELQGVNAVLGGISNDLNTTIYGILQQILTSNQNSETYLSGIGLLATENTLVTLYNFIGNNLDVQLSTRASEATLQSILTQLDTPLSLLQADIQNVNASLATTNNYLANIDLSTQSVATKLAEPTNSLILPITPTTALNNGSESLIIGAANKKTVLIANGTNRTIYVAYGATANTTNNYSFRILANTFERIEIGANLDFSYSIVQNTATGTINITELN